MQRFWSKSIKEIGAITICGVLLSGCGSIIKPIVKAGFKALSKNSDELISSASKGISKNSDTFTKGITTSSENLYTSPNTSAWNQFSNQEIITSKPARILVKEAIGHDQKQNYQEEVGRLNQEIAVKPSYSLYYSRGLIKSRNLNDHEGALYDLNQAIRLNPFKDNAYIVRGIVKSDLGDYQGSISDYTKAINLNQNNYLGFYNRGTVKAKYLRDFRSACLDFKEAAELGYAPAKTIFANLDCNQFSKL